MSVGENIKLTRKRLNMKQVELAKSAWITQAYMCDIEKGRSVPSLDTLYNIANALNVSVLMLLGDICCYKRIQENKATEHEFSNEKCLECELFKHYNKNI